MKDPFQGRAKGLLLGAVMLLMIGSAIHALYWLRHGCNGLVCVHVEIEEPAAALEPVLVTVAVRTRKNVSGLGVGLISKAGEIARLGQSPQNAVVAYQDDVSVDWRFDAKGGKRYVFSAYVTLQHPSAYYGFWSYHVNAYASHPRMGFVSNTARVVLDAEGHQVEDSVVRKTQWLVEETVYLGTPRPTWTPAPTITARPTPTRRSTRTPTPTPLPTPTRTPTPTRMMGHPARSPLATPFLPPITPPYPYPQP